LLIIFNLFNLPTALNFSDWSGNIQAQKQIVSLISLDQKNNSSYNLIVLQSPDGNTLGLRFKDQLLLKNISPANVNDYHNINTLYVISYQPDWTRLSRDPAYELNDFRSAKPISSTKIHGSDWIVYQLSKK
jgi:hypothetical protein